MISWGDHEIILVRYQINTHCRGGNSSLITVLRRASTILPLGLAGVAVRQLAMASALARVARLDKMAPA